MMESEPRQPLFMASTRTSMAAKLGNDRWKPWLRFAQGALLAAAVGMYVAADSEDTLFSQIAMAATANVPDEPLPQVKALVATTHSILEPRIQLLNDHPPSHPITGWVDSAAMHLLSGKGACGSSAIVAVKLLNSRGLPARLVQMEANGSKQGHIVIEFQIGEQWFVADPRFNLVFENSDGSPVSARQLLQNWPHYYAQVPEDYPEQYRYEGLRRTNWEKIPILLPALEKALVWLIGENRTAEISLRTPFINKFRVSFFGFVAVLLLTQLPWRCLPTLRKRERVPEFPILNGARPAELART